MLHSTMKLLFSIILFIFSVLNVSAQDFEILRPQDYPVGESLPVYCHQIQLEEGLDANNVKVVVEYPEYVKLTSKEVKTLKQYGIELSERLQVNTTFGMARKKGVLEVSFAPFLKLNDQLVRLTSIRVNVTPIQTKQARSSARVNKASAERYSESSVLSSGKWIKIAVKDEGIYQLTPQLIKEWGFSDFSKIKVYGYGGLPLEKKLYGTNTTCIDDLNEIPTYRTTEKILFYANGVIRSTWNNSYKRWKHEINPYTTHSYYFVTEGDAPLTIATDATVSTNATISEVQHHVVYDVDSYAWYKGGKQFYDAYNFATGNVKTYNLNTPNATEASASLEVSFSASSTTSSTTVQVSSADQSLGSFNIRYCREHEHAIDKRQTYKLEKLSDVTPITFKTTQGKDARLNYLSLTYPCKLSASGTPYSFVPTPISSTPVSLQIVSASTNTQVWRIDDATGNISNCATTIDGGTLLATAINGKNRYIIVNTNASYNSPILVGNVSNQNLHADNGVQMVIIVPESGKFTDEANRLAEAHRAYSHLNVKVIAQHQIFNEFSSGTPDATAVRRYLKMLYDRAMTDDEMPRYLLLFGDGTYDNRMVTTEWQAQSPKDYLLIYEDNENYDTSSENVIGDIVSYPSDDYYGLLDDGEGSNLKTEKIDLGIGRFVCSTVEDAKTLVDKSIAYLQNQRTGNWKNRIVMIGDAPRSTDVGDKNAHMEDAERTAQTIEASSNGLLNIRRIYPDYYERQMTAVGYRFPKASQQLKEEIKRGALMFNYSGHGSPAQISHSFILEASDWETLSSNALPIWVLASCEILPYDQNTNDFGRKALFSSHGGAVAVMCASRAVYATENNALNVAFCDALVKRNADGSYNTFGDALRIAKNKLISTSQDRSINKLKYIIAGDPALRLMQPTLSIVVDSINNAPLNTTDNYELKAGSVATIHGYVDNESEFKGIVTATLYDKLEQLTCRNSGNVADEPFTFSERTKIVFTGSDSITNGRFKIFIPIPRDISYSNESARLTLYAVNHDFQKEATGYVENIHLNGTDNQHTNDTTGPNVYLFLNETEFPNGGVTNSNPLFIARLSDESGINATGTSLGHDIELILDDQPNNLIVLNDYFAYDFGTYQEGTVNYQLQNLTPGSHSLTFRVWDHNNNSTTSTLDFIVGTDHQLKKSLCATINPARSFTQFVANVSESHVGGTITFEVYTTTGQKVWSNVQKIQTSHPTLHWNLTSNSNIPLPKGIYIFRAKIESQNGSEEIDGERLIII